MTETTTITIISALCIIVGILIGAIIIGKVKTKEKATKAEKAKKKVVKVKTKIEFSKLLLIITGAVASIIIAGAMFMSYQTQSTDVFAYLIPSIFGLLTIAYPFYYVKAKAENLLKIRGSLGEEAADFARKVVNKDDDMMY